MPQRPRLLISVVLVALLGLGGWPAWSADFVLLSQNLLRFGQGSKTAQKCQALENKAADVDIILIQELMTAAYPCASVPADFTFMSFGPYGTTSYKEYYGFLWRSTQSGAHPKIEYTTYYHAASQSDYMRPPTAMLFKVTRQPSTGGTFLIWVGNMHSVFGKTISGRRDEATKAGNYFQGLRTMVVGTDQPPTGGWPTLIAGDWNLPVTNSAGVVDSGFSWLAGQNAAGLPTNIATSLTRAGGASSPYDHILYNTVTGGHGVTISNVQLVPLNQNDWPTWRQTVSDHLGVQAEVTVQ